VLVNSPTTNEGTGMEQDGVTQSGTISWRDLHADLVDRLGDPSARWLCEEASGREGGDWLAHLDDPATVLAVARLDSMSRRRAAGEPLQYVIGHWPFRGLDLVVDRRVLIPRPETERVVEVALEELDRLGGRERPTTVVDLGTGSGAIALSIAVERPLTRVVATDRSSDAIAVARANTTGIGRHGARVTVIEGFWFEPVDRALRGAIDLVVSNPPYVAAGNELPPEVQDWEPAAALRAGDDGLDDIRVIIDGCPDWLSPMGALVIELAPDQVVAAAEMARAAGFTSVRSANDLAGRQRALIARLRS